MAADPALRVQPQVHSEVDMRQLLVSKFSQTLSCSSLHNESVLCGIFDVLRPKGENEAVMISSNFDNVGGNTNINRCSLKKRFQRTYFCSIF